MSNIKNYIFNRKILNRILEKEKEGLEGKFNELKPILEEYAGQIESGRIFKFKKGCRPMTCDM
ncbi:MAG: hypothetical protein PHV06_12370 [bacterium]|nr:hypothetical protein [bacterium]